MPADQVITPRRARVPTLSVLLFPWRAFATAGEKPRWALRLVLTVVVAALPAVVFVTRADTERLAERTLAKSDRLAEAPLAERPALVAKTSKALKAGLPAAAAGRRALWVLLVAGLAFALLRGPCPAIRFGQVAAVIALATAPLWLHDAIKLAQAATRDPLWIDLDNPVAANPAAWLGLDTRRSVGGALLKGLDLFRLWTVGLTALGLRALSGKRGWLIVAAPWVVYLAGLGLDGLWAALRG